MSQHDNDDVLLQRAQDSPSGDLRVFEGLVQRQQDRILANCRDMTGSPETAEDLAQGVFVKACFALPRFEKSGRFWHLGEANKGESLLESHSKGQKEHFRGCG